MRLAFGQFILDVDVERTRAYYHSQETGIGCDCSGCRNYERAAEAFSEKLRDFFRTLGIDPGKPAEVYVSYTRADGTLLYGGFYHLCGTLLQGKGGWQAVYAGPKNKTSVWKRETCYSVTDRFFIAFTEDIVLLEDGFPTPVLQMEIDASLPWMLEEENDYPRDD